MPEWKLGMKADGTPPDTAWKPGQRPMGAGRKPNLLSAAYKAQLAKPMSADLAQALGLPDEEEHNYAEAIAHVVVHRAIGKVKDDQICFRAITELRETTEGKTPEKIIAAGTNEELVALATIMKGEPAPPDSDLMEDDRSSESAEADFHGNPSNDE